MKVTTGVPVTTLGQVDDPNPYNCNYKLKLYLQKSNWGGSRVKFKIDESWANEEIILQAGGSDVLDLTYSLDTGSYRNYGARAWNASMLFQATETPTPAATPTPTVTPTINYPPSTSNISPSSGPPGTQVTASGFYPYPPPIPNWNYSVKFADIQLTTVQPSSQGDWKVSFTVPSLPVGTYQVTFPGPVKYFTITAGPTPTPTLNYPTPSITPSHIVRGKIEGLSTAEVTGWLDDTQIGVANCR